ncbi:MAG: hypothetical protein AB4426_33590 [Xenococcaceae cyanobacterium]
MRVKQTIDLIRIRVYTPYGEVWFCPNPYQGLKYFGASTTSHYLSILYPQRLKRFPKEASSLRNLGLFSAIALSF